MAQAVRLFLWGVFVLKKIKKKHDKWVMKHVPSVADISDLVGRNKDGKVNESSFLFLLLCRLFKHQLESNNDIVKNYSIRLRKVFIYKVLQILGPIFLSQKKLIRETIVQLPKDRPIIFAPNHGFVEDAISTILISGESSYILFGSLPRYFNTFDGVAAYLNGTILANRKSKKSRNDSVEKAVSVLKRNGNLLLFPEGVWNKTANRLTLSFWPGIFKIAKRTNAFIVPIVHLLVNDEIHSSRLHAIDIKQYGDNDTEEMLIDLQTTINTELFSLMQKYAYVSREELISDDSSVLVGERLLKQRIATCGKYYDYPLEISIDYQKKTDIKELDVWKPIANIKPTKDNMLHYLYANERVKTLTREDFQHRF